MMKLKLQFGAVRSVDWVPLGEYVERFTKLFLAVITVAAFGFASNASAYWQVTYDLSGTTQTITGTPLMAGDADVAIGPGTLVLDFIGAPTSGTPITAGDTVSMASLQIVQDFGIVTIPATIATLNVTELGRPIGGLTDTDWGAGVLYPDGTTVQAGSLGTAGSAAGTWDGTNVNWGGPALNWSGFGATTCTGLAGFCTLGGWTDGSGEEPRIDDTLQDLPLVAFLLTDPNTVGSGFSAVPLETYNGADAHTFINFVGTVSTVLWVVPEPGTALLLGSGLLGLATVGRRRKV